jgi:hypothetical protein
MKVYYVIDVREVDGHQNMQLFFSKKDAADYVNSMKNENIYFQILEKEVIE